MERNYHNIYNEVRVQDKVESISHSKPLERRQEGNIRIQHAETSAKIKGIGIILK